MNLFDRMIAAASPERALKRALARAQLDRLTTLQTKRSGYDGAKVGGRVAWSAGNNSANTELGPALSRLRARSHDLVRNNPYADRDIS